MSAQHTQEPWRIAHCCDNHKDEAEWPWLTVVGPAMGGAGGKQFRPADARRIVACVNACAGLADADIATITEHGGVVELYNALPDLLATVRLLRDVEQHNIELLKALAPLALKSVSGNSVPVERAIITAEEWRPVAELLCDYDYINCAEWAQKLAGDSSTI